MRAHTFIWVLIIASILLIAPLVVPPGTFRASIDTDVNSAIRWYGQAETVHLLNTANGLYKTVMVQTGIDAFIRGHYVGSMDPRDFLNIKLSQEVLLYTGHALGYWESLLTIIYLFFIRIAAAWMWLCYLSPFLIAICIDGVMMRKAKRASFRYTSPTVYNVGWHLIIFCSCISLVFFALPGPLNIFYYPAVITLSGALARVVISNIQYSA